MQNGDSYRNACRSRRKAHQQPEVSPVDRQHAVENLAHRERPEIIGWNRARSGCRSRTVIRGIRADPILRCHSALRAGRLFLWGRLPKNGSTVAAPIRWFSPIAPAAVLSAMRSGFPETCTILPVPNVLCREVRLGEHT